MRYSYGIVTFSEDFGHCKMRCCFGCVLGGSGGGFWRHFGPDLVAFEGLERSPILSSKLKTEKVVSGTRRGVRGVGRAALIRVLNVGS